MQWSVRRVPEGGAGASRAGPSSQSHTTGGSPCQQPGCRHLTPRFSPSRARPPTCTSAGPRRSARRRAGRGRLSRSCSSTFAAASRGTPRFRQRLAPTPLRLNAPAVDRRRRVRRRAAHRSRVLRDAQRGGRRLHVPPARSRPAALAAVHRRPARRRPDRSRGQGAPLHGRRDRRGGAGRAAARPDPGADALRARTAGDPAPEPDALSRLSRAACSTRCAADLGLLRLPARALRSPAYALAPGGERGPRGAGGARHAAPRDARAPGERAAVPASGTWRARSCPLVGPAADQDRASTRRSTT